MSEIYIRSQNREKLYQFGGRFSGLEYRKVAEEDGTLHHAIFLTGGMETGGIPGISAVAEDIAVRMGGYDTKERCLKILDEIQQVCGQCLTWKGGVAAIHGDLTWSGGGGILHGGMDIQPGAVAIPRIYEMPEK